jgi:hypothetical protein
VPLIIGLGVLSLVVLAFVALLRVSIVLRYRVRRAAHDLPPLRRSRHADPLKEARGDRRLDVGGGRGLGIPAAHE